MQFRFQISPKKFGFYLAVPVVTSLIPVQAAPTLRKTAPVPVKAASASAAATLPLANWDYVFADDDLEETWSYAVRLDASGSGPFVARVVFHYTDAQNYLLLQIQNDGKATSFSFHRVANGRVAPLGEPQVALPGVRGGQLTLQRSAWRMRALWNGRVLLSAFGPFEGGKIGTAARGAKFDEARLQPTEAIVKQDDFMTAQGPQDANTAPDEVLAANRILRYRRTALLKVAPTPVPEVKQSASEWRVVSGSWKTSMMMDSRVRFDSSLNPNPFVYRAEGKESGQAASAVGKWFWSDYSVAVALKPVLKNPQTPLVAGVAAYGQQNGSALVGEVDFRSGRASLRQGSVVLAQSAPFACAPNQWHRLYLDPGPGTMRLLVDGVERLRVAAPPSPANWQNRALSQGEASLRATTGGGNFVDFDDVNIASSDAISDDFALPSVGRWDDVNGAWDTKTGANTGRRTKTTGGAALSLTGDAERAEGRIEASFEAKSGAPVGLAFAVRDAKNYFLARQRKGALEIVEYINGAGRILASQANALSGNAASGAVVPLSVEWRDGVISLRSKSSVATTTVNAVPSGRVGLWADGAANMASATSFLAMGVAPGFGEPPLPDRFQKDRLMRQWASNAAAWKALSFTPDQSARFFISDEEKAKAKGREQIYMHTGDFFSDAELTVPVPDIAVGARLVVHLRDNLSDEAVLAPIYKNAAVMRKTLAPPTDVKVKTFQPGGARLEIERVAENWQFKLYEGVTLVKTATAPRVAGDAKAEKRPALRFVRRALGGQQVALRVALDGKMLFSETAPASEAGTKLLVRLLSVPIFVDYNYSTTEKTKVPPSHFSFEDAVAETTARLDYAFTGAPTDWFASRGRWEVAERWTCQPQFGFFRGDNAIDPTLWSRFSAKGDWTLEAYMATPMDQTRGERSPQDLNITVGGDGRDLDSGYSFLFAPHGDQVHLILRGGERAFKTASVMPSVQGSVHQDWYYIRLERRATEQGLRFRWVVNGKEIANYLDEKPLAAALDTPGRFAFWSHNFGLSIARVRLWHAGLEVAPETGSGEPLEKLVSTPNAPNSLGEWAPRRDGILETSARFQSVTEGKSPALRVTNPQSGGDWTLFATHSQIDAATRPVLKFDYRVPQDVFINLYVKNSGRWREIAFTGDLSRAVLPAAPPETDIRLGKIEGVIADNQWHSASFDLQKALAKLGLPSQVEAIAFAAPERDYLRAGIGGNHQGATYYLRDFQAPPAALASAK